MPPFSGRHQGLRWGGAALVAAALHAGAVCAFVWRAQEADEDAGAPVVMMDLAPIASAPGRQPTDLPPGPEQDEAAERQASLAAQKERNDDAPLLKEQTRNDDADALQQPEKRPVTQETAEAADASQAAEASAPQAADTLAATAKGPPIGADARKPSRALIDWRNAMAGRLKRFHRYPHEAHGANGTALVEFAIDREGRLLRRRLVRSSMNAALDRDAESLIERAAPYPPPPRDVSDAFLTISAPVRYDSRAK